ncbi:MAG TPA: helix-turn-helix transcriptional regulator [Pseudonocardiaceae bacterium]|nr:helix-turn-helix transcriptional regulator [Pseudonocardiaceae bacterium]
MALGSQLRRLRESRGISLEAAGAAIRGSHAKISRLELGRVGSKQRDLLDLLTLYGVQDQDERAAFLALAQQANTPGWWHQYSDVLPTWFETYLGLEQAAALIRGYEPQFVPGLLQTAEYARAVIRLAHTGEPDDDVESRVALRMDRQRILTAADAPAVWLVVDAAALRRPYGGRAVLRGQIEHLLRVGELPTVTIQVVPYEAGGHAAAGGGFAILRFAAPELPDIVYLEQLTSALYLDKQSDVDQYSSVMNRLAIQAHTPERTRDFLAALVAEY